MTRLEEIYNSLPPDLQREVEDFAAFLAGKSRQPDGGEPRSRKRHLSGEGWFGALSELKGQYKSGLDLQKKSLEDWERQD